MQTSIIPHLAIVRAITAGGPFAVDDEISVAFAHPTTGRIVPHRAREEPSSPAPKPALIPETISVLVLVAAGPYGTGDVLTLSFVDPSFARIHPSAGTSRVTAASVGVHVPDMRALAASDIAQNFFESKTFENNTPPKYEVMSDAVVSAGFVASVDAAASSATRNTEETPEPLPQAAIVSDVGVPSIPDSGGVRFSLAWSEDRVRRFVQVTDKLFTVDRLGWYRHAFAMRLLVPDEITCGDRVADDEAAKHLKALRSAALETLGRPLIAAFMPSFSVTPDWLDAIDSPTAAKALVGLRATIAPYASQDARVACGYDDPPRTFGSVSCGELTLAPAGSVEALLPLLIPNVSEFADITERLTTYRQALVDLFGGTAQSAETVRLGQMAQPNHTLDDRLWQLVGTISERFGGLAVA